jgi:hypothetical protein
MTTPRVVLSNSRLDLRQDRSLALKSLLIELGYSSAEDLVNEINNVVLNNSFFGYLRLPIYLRHPTLSVCCHLFCYLYDFIPRQALIQSAITSAPGFSSGISGILDQLITTDFSNYPDLLETLEVSSLDVFSILQEPVAFTNWITANWAEFESFASAIRDKNTSKLVLSVLQLDPYLKLRVTDNLDKEITYWSDITFKQQVFGSDYHA